QEEAVKIGAGGAYHLAGRIDELEIQPFEADPAALDDCALDVAAADEADLDVGRHSRTRHDHLQRLAGNEHRIIEAGRVDADSNRLEWRQTADGDRALLVGRPVGLASAGGDQRALFERLGGIVDAVAVEIAVNDRMEL